MARDDPQFQFYPIAVPGRLSTTPLAAPRQGAGSASGAFASPAAAAPAAAGARSPGPQASTTAQPVQDTSIPAPGRALLATIGGPGFESNGSYTQRFNQPDFSDFSKHPGTFGNIERGPNKGLKSNAAGRYQFISSTWGDQAKKLGLSDFSPASQDRAAWNLAQETYRAKYPGRDLAGDLNNPGRLPQIAQALKSQWSSLPGGMEQGGSLAKFASTYMSNLRTETARSGGGQPTAQPARPMILTSDPWAITGAMGGGQGGGSSGSIAFDPGRV